MSIISSEMIDPVVSGDIQLAMIYSSDGLQAQRKSSGVVKFIVPQEGCTIATDNFVIPKGSQNPEGAHDLINFLLSTEQHQKMVEKILAGPVVKGVKDRLSADLTNDKGLFPDPAALSKCEPMLDLGEHAIAYERLWTEVKAE